MFNRMDKIHSKSVIEIQFDTNLCQTEIVWEKNFEHVLLDILNSFTIHGPSRLVSSSFLNFYSPIQTLGLSPLVTSDGRTNKWYVPYWCHKYPRLWKNIRLNKFSLRSQCIQKNCDSTHIFEHPHFIIKRMK